MALAPGQVALTSCRLGKLRLDAARLNAVLGPPATPVAVSPVNGFVGGPYTLQWSASGAATYDVRFGTTASPPTVATGTTATSYALPALTPGVVYYWQVVAHNVYGQTTGPIWTFTAAVPPAPTTPTPPDGTHGIGNSVVLSWVQPGAEPITSWRVYFGAGAPVYYGTTSAPSIGIPPPLTNATVYVWTAQAVNNAGWSVIPGYWTFVTWELGAPTTPNPPDGAVDVSLSTTLSWGAATNAATYDVYLGSTLVQSGPGLSYDPPSDLGVETRYTWHVVARNAGGSTVGPTWTFTTTDPLRLQIAIDGVRPHMRIAGLTIQDTLNDAPNTARFTVDTTPPHVGQVVQIGLGTLTGPDLLFAGTIQAVDETYEGIPANRAWQVSCIDWWQRLNRYKVLRHYDEQSATAIATDLVTRYGRGFTTGAIAAGLPTVVGGIDFTNEDLGACLRRLMQRVGGYWYVDYTKVVHAFLTETTAPPSPVVPTSPTLLLEPTVSDASDLSQIRTRTIVVGSSASTTTDIAVTDSIVPLEDASAFNPSGGQALAGTARFPYTGTIAGGGKGSFIVGLPGPGSAGAPSAALNGAGDVLGTVAYKVSYAAGGGETVPGNASNSVTGVALAPPTGTPSLAFASGLGRLIGSYVYALTYTTAKGETLTGPRTGVATTTAVATPPAPSVAAEPNVIGVLLGAYGYKVSFVTALGETLPSPVASRTATAFPAPTVTPSWTAVNAIAALRPGDYRWAITYITAMGETLPGPNGLFTVGAWTAGGTTWSSNSAAGGGSVPAGAYDYATAYVDASGGVSYLGSSQNVNVPTGGIAVTCNIPIGPTGTTARRLYRRAGAGNPWKLVATISNNTDATGVDNAQVAGAAWDGGTMGQPVQTTVGALPTNVVRLRFYRTKNGGTGDYFFVGEATSGTFTDAHGDSDLTVLAPSVATAGGQQHRITIPTGQTNPPSGVIARRLYRTSAGGADYKLLLEVQDNTTTSVLDNVAAAGGQAPLLVATAGGQSINVTVPSAPTGFGLLTQRIYRTKNGGTGTLFLIGEIAVGGGTWLDDKLDTELGQQQPSANTAGASAVQVSAIPIGPTGITARRLYRSDSTGLFRYLAEISDNTTATYLDTLAEANLGDAAPTVSTIGALAGATTITLSSVASFPASGGWVTSGSQKFRYTGISGTTLTGIPASGPGSLLAPLKAGDEIVLESALTGVALVAALARGDSVAVLEQRDATADQAALAALEGGDSDGIYEHVITDSRLAWRDAQGTGDADLKLFSKPIATLRYACRDRKTVSGKTVHADLPSLGITGDFLIQTVTIDQIGVAKGLLPRYTVEASSVRWTFEDLLRQLLVQIT